MSVENIEALSPPNGYPERTENTNDATEKVEEGEQGGSPQVASVIPSAMGDELSAPIQSENPIRAQRMEWIDNLSEKELLRMFTLADVPFLASLLAVSSLSSSARGHMDRPSGISAGEYHFNKRLVGSAPPFVCDLDTKVKAKVQRAFCGLEAYLPSRDKKRVGVGIHPPFVRH